MHESSIPERHRATEARIRSIRHPAWAALATVAIAVLLASMRARLAVAQEKPDAAGRGVDVRVVEKSTGKSIAGAQVIYWINNKGNALAADARGRCRVPFPDDMANFSIIARAPGFVPRGYHWWHPLSSKPPIPRELVFHHEPAMALGGIVQDEQGKPIAGAMISLTMGLGSGDLTEEHVAISAETAQTDDRGQWTANVFPNAIGELTIEASHPRFLDAQAVARSAPELSIERLRAGTALLMMRPGTEIAGLVLDEQGNPIPEARIGFGVNADRGRQIITTTNAAGVFSLGNARPEPGTLVADAAGFAVESRAITPAPGAPRVTFRLKPGRPVTLRITDPDGKPLAGAQVQAQAQRVVPMKPGQADFEVGWEHVDAAGRYVYTQAGEAPVAFSVYHEGYFFENTARLAPDKEHPIVLKPALVVRGAVVDDETGKPLARGVAHFVKLYSDGSGGVVPYDERAWEDGRYSVLLDDQCEKFGVRISAEGYSPADSPLVEFAKAPAVSTFDIRLKKSNQPRRRIAQPGGQPADGACAVVCDSGSSIYMSARKPDYNGMSPLLRATDKGEIGFTPPPNDEWRLSITHASGWAIAEPAAVAKGSVTLVPWGTLRGTVLVNGRPAEGIVVSVSSLRPGVADDAVPTFLDEVITGRDGRFEFARVPCRPLTVGRKAYLSGGSSTSTDELSVLVDPGGVAEVVLGKPGRAIVGRIVLENAGGAHLDPDIFLSAGEEAPKGLAGFSDLAAARKFWASPEYQRYMASQRRYCATLAADGTFTFPSIDPGEYVLRSRAVGNELRRSRYRDHKHAISVPAGADSPAKPLDVGTIRYTPVRNEGRQPD